MGEPRSWAERMSPTFDEANEALRALGDERQLLPTPADHWDLRLPVDYVSPGAVAAVRAAGEQQLRPQPPSDIACPTPPPRLRTLEDLLPPRTLDVLRAQEAFQRWVSESYLAELRREMERLGLIMRGEATVGKKDDEQRAKDWEKGNRAAASTARGHVPDPEELERLELERLRREEQDKG